MDFQDFIEPGTLLIDIATRDVICLMPKNSVGEAARTMSVKHISSILVTDVEGHPLGIVTERNIVYAMQSNCLPETTLKEVMSSPVITVPESITCLDAYQFCLRDGIRHLVIVNVDNRLLGVVSETDFRQHMDLTALAGHRLVASVMSRSVFTLPPQACLQEALNQMQLQHDTFVVVVEADRPVGIITERDIVHLYSSNQERTDINVSDVMSSPVISISLDSSINHAAEKMLTTKVRHLVVVDATGRISGLLSEHNLTQSIALRLIDDKLIAEGAFLHTLINTIPDLIWLKDVNGIYLACNPRFERFFGAPEKEIVGKTDYDFVEKELADFFRENDQIAIKKNAANVNEEWITYADDGHRELVEALKTPMHDNKGELIGILGIARDITERKVREGELTKLSFALNHVREAAFLIDENARFLYVNDEACRALGYSKDELLGGMKVTDIDPDWTDERWDRHWPVTKAKGSITFEARHKTKSGCIFPVEVNANYFEYDDRGYNMALVRDITAHKKADALLRKQKQFSDDVINSLPGIFYMLNQQGFFVRVNPNFLKVSEYSNEEILNMSALSCFEGIDRDVIEAKVREVFEFGDSCAEAEFITKSGQRIPYIFSGHRTMIEDQPFLVGLGIDNSVRKRSEENLRIAASVFENSQEAILITDANNIITDVNFAVTQITGYSREEILGKNPKFLSSGRQDEAFYKAMWQALKQDKQWRGEIWNRRKSGEVYVELLSISAICDNNGRVQRYVGVFSDISYLKEYEAKLSRVAHYDALTGIPNRVLLADRMRQAIAKATREQNMVAFCYLDLDGFKSINDSVGHEAGDKVLVEVALRIGNNLRGGDTIARLGGDEFVVLLGMEKGEECIATLKRILTVIAEPIFIKDKPYMVSASIGVSIFPLDEDDPDILLRHADQAMYVAKQSGKNRFYIYDIELDSRIRKHNEFLQSVLRGLEYNQFELHYQPKINLRTKLMVGAEALIRWRHPERGLLPPSEFLSHIANTELDIKIGNWVIATALDQLDRWRRVGLNIELSINISAYHLESTGFVENLQQQLVYYSGMPMGKLQIEILETIALTDLAIVREIIEECRKLGIEFALDDFGTGYSSLSYLSRLPINVLKIDQSFVRDMLEDEGDKAIIQGIIALARVFDHQTVAEGIETDEQYLTLLDMGCEIGQGYGISKPMAANELTKLLTNGSLNL